MKHLVVIVWALAVAGCGNSAATNKETLTESIRSYNDGIRWGRFDAAAVLRPARERSQFADDMDKRAKDVKITDYDIIRVDEKGDRLAKVQIKMSWYNDLEGTLHETHSMQTWERHGKAWLMVEEARYRGAEMPGLADKLKD
ncbi:MAG TPA: hypothetical protein VGO00_02150 [Kofleriaceae bacterium]|jgi:hypothetical protein|nr:hypothetical protein [Kofleriaceae bacterium]